MYERKECKILKYFNSCIHILIHVAACNKTYYGDVGKTYDLELHRPKEDKVPYICKLTFNAPGDDFGDIVQVSLQTIQRFLIIININITSITFASLFINIFFMNYEKRRVSKICNKLHFTESGFN